MNRVLAIAAVAFVAGVVIGAPPKNDDVLHYLKNEKWVEIKSSECSHFDAGDGCVFVEIPMGHTGLHPLDGILAPYDRFKDSKRLVAFNKEKNIAILAWNRWNNAALCLSSPDSDEILAKHGFKCSSLDVVRLLRLTYR